MMFFTLVLDEGRRSPGREGNHHSSQSHNKCTSSLHGKINSIPYGPLWSTTTSGFALFPDEKCRGHSELDGSSLCSSSGDSASGAPSRLVPGHRIWADRNGRHILGLIEDYSALRKQISDGRKLSRGLITQLQECVQVFRHSSPDNKVLLFLIRLVSVWN